MSARLCIICHKPFSEKDEVFKPIFHEDCSNCYYCHNPVGRETIQKLVDKEDKQTLVPILVWHQPCRDTALEQEFKQKPVTITQEHLELLTKSHLFMIQLTQQNPDILMETSQDITDKMSLPWFNDLDLDGKFYFLKQVEALLTRINIALSKDKDIARTRAQERDLKKFKEVVEYRDGQDNAKQVQRMKSLDQITIDNEKANPQLKARRKAIEAFMKIGLSRQDAERMADSANKPN